MTILLTCLFIAMLLPYLSKLPLAYAMHQQGGYDNNHPRDQQARLSGFGARALAAHQNSFEALLVFGLAVLAAVATQTISPLIEYLAIIHIVSRIVYHILYLKNYATCRSIVWFIGLACSLTILGLCI